MRSVLKRLLPKIPRLAVKGVYDVDATAIEKLREAFGASNPRAYPSMESLVDDPEIDWVMIGTWNRFHAAPVIAALNAGKNVFCEKPLATTLADCVAVQNAVRRSKGIFAFGLVLRFSPHYQRIHQTLADGRIGELISFEFNETLRPGHGGYIFGNWRRRTEMAGSHILEKCCHDLDIANWMAGNVPNCAAIGGKRIFTQENAGLGEQIGLDAEGLGSVEWPDAHRVDPFSGDLDLMDHQVVILEYANGVAARLSMRIAWRRCRSGGFIFSELAGRSAPMRTMVPLPCTESGAKPTLKILRSGRIRMDMAAATAFWRRGLRRLCWGDASRWRGLMRR